MSALRVKILATFISSSTSVGGAADMRQYWNNFIPENGVLVYVIDASDGVRFLKAKEELMNFLKDDRTKNLPLIIVGNKQVSVSDLSAIEKSSSLYVHATQAVSWNN